MSKWLWFLQLWCVFFLLCLLGLAGVSRQDEGQQRVSRGDDIFGNGKHQDALPVYCLWKTSLFVNCCVCLYLLLFSNHILNFLYPLFSCWCWCFSISCLLVPCFQIPAQQTTPSPAQLHAQQVESRRHCAQEGSWGWVPEGTGQHQRVGAVCQWG